MAKYIAMLCLVGLLIVPRRQYGEVTWWLVAMALLFAGFGSWVVHLWQKQDGKL